MKSPAFQFYPNDWLGSQRVQMLTLEEEGAYMRLLCFCWQHGSIPSDPVQAARLIGKGGSTTLATVVLAMFQPSPEAGRLVHDRLEAERQKQAAWREKSAAGGRKSAENRKGGSTTLQPPLEGSLENGTNQKATLQSTSTSSSTSSDSNSEHKQRSPAAPKVFVPPSPEEVTAYSAEIGYPLDGQGWCDAYAQKGWAIRGSTKMKDWKAAVRNWKTSGYKIGPQDTLFMSRDMRAKAELEQRLANPNARI